MLCRVLISEKKKNGQENPFIFQCCKFNAETIIHRRLNDVILLISLKFFLLFISEFLKFLIPLFQCILKLLYPFPIFDA